MKKKLLTIQKKYRYIALGAIVLLGFFLYAKIVYFPQRASLGANVSFTFDQNEIDRARSLDIGSLHAFTGDYIVSQNTLASMEAVYKDTHDQKVALSLLQLYITHYQFDKAFMLIKDMYRKDIDFAVVPAETFLYIFFNSSQLSPSNYELIHGIIADYSSQERITSDEALFYQSLLALYSGDQNTFYAGIHSLSGSEAYKEIYDDIINAEKASNEIGTNLTYYADGLSALALLQEGYFRVAQKWAVAIRSKDSKYILPYQILAQAALLQSHRDEAAQYFDTLLKMDPTHPSQYQFGLCRSYFWLEQYSKSLVHCQQVRDGNASDAMRYVLLGYYQMKDWQGMMNTFQSILAKKKTTENDYYTFFDIIFYQPYVSDKNFEHVQKYYVSVVLPYLNQCVSDFGENHTVCKYGQAGFYLYK